jgi:hypothetical protein
MIYPSGAGLLKRPPTRIGAMGVGNGPPQCSERLEQLDSESVALEAKTGGSWPPLSVSA